MNSMEPNQAWQYVRPDLDPNCLTLWFYSWNFICWNFIPEILFDDGKKACKITKLAELNLCPISDPGVISSIPVMNHTFVDIL